MTDPYLEAMTSVRTEIAGLRDDVREDISEIRRELAQAVSDYTLVHGREHERDRTELAALVDDAEVVHERFLEFIRAAELAQARRDGALGAFRFVVELLGRYYRPIGALIATVALAAAAISGAITVEIGIH